MVNLHKQITQTKLPIVLRQLFQEEAAGGRLILVAAALALAVTNLGWQVGYENWWQADLKIGLGGWSLTQDLKHWVNDGLMTIFFLVVGLEIKREIITGELRALKSATLPIAAAVGGMVVPALLYLLLNINQSSSRGWGIPMATDIAIAVGLLMLLGKQIPSKLKIFLLTLAIVDDIGATIVIAAFYNQQIYWPALLVATLLICGLVLLNRSRFMALPIFGLLGVCLWLAVHTSGISASITGVILGLSAPLVPTRFHTRPIAVHLEKALLPIASFIVVPLFVFANAGVNFTLVPFDKPDMLPTALGVMLGLTVGKVAGITGAIWLVVKLRLGRLPVGTSWPQFIGIGFLAGIGFTISIFITELAFADNRHLIHAAKVGIFAGSVISAGLGIYCLKKVTSKSF